MKSVAHRFYNLCPDLKLKKKIKEFECLVLVLRGDETEIGEVFDREKFRVRTEQGGMEATPQTIFVTEPAYKDPILEFLLLSKQVKLYHDFTQAFDHLIGTTLLVINSQKDPTELQMGYD